jgi:hypothetical protein
LEGGEEKTPGRYIGFLEESRANTTHRPAHCGAEAKKKWQVRVEEEYHQKYIILGDTPRVAAGIFKQTFKVK